jgi:hypothetical protein|tara:strand:- start:5476 stop:5610 length:135 start_codon:yes stop_codon:yes gene_type:complete
LFIVVERAAGRFQKSVKIAMENEREDELIRTKNNLSTGVTLAMK